MGLFAALTAPEGTTPAATQSSSPPEAIQLHADRALDFLEGAAVHVAVGAKTGGEGSKRKEGSASGEGHSRYYSALSYQAVQTQQDEGPLPGKAAGGSTTAQRHARPDLGIWDCRVEGSNAAASATLLKRVVMGQKIEADEGPGPSEEEKGGESDAADQAGKNDESVKPVVLAVDISEPAEVQPVVERMREVILNTFDGKEKSDNCNPRICTTTVKALQNAQFGKAKIQEEVAKDGSSGEPRIALILAVIVPSKNAASSMSAADEYLEKQSLALLLYHLHKFALETNGTLCFVSEKGSSAPPVETPGTEGEEKKSDSAGESDLLMGRNSTMSVDELGKVIRRVAMGLTPVEDGDLMQQNEEGKEEGKDEIASIPPSIHVPGSHDAELIHGAYLRNASCDGRWDAATDNLEAALPPRTSGNANDETAKEETSEGKGDEEWLSQLASSIGLSPDSAPASAASSRASSRATTPTRERKEKAKKPVAKPKRATRSSARNKDSKPKDEKEVMNFFDNLLKDKK